MYVCERVLRIENGDDNSNNKTRDDDESRVKLRKLGGGGVRREIVHDIFNTPFTPFPQFVRPVNFYISLRTHQTTRCLRSHFAFFGFYLISAKRLSAPTRFAVNTQIRFDITFCLLLLKLCVRLIHFLFAVDTCDNELRLFLCSPPHSVLAFASWFRKVCALNRQINRERAQPFYGYGLRPTIFMTHIWTHITIVFISVVSDSSLASASILFAMCFYSVKDLFL